MRGPAGIDVVALDRWLRVHTSAIAPPLRWEAIAGGRSNLTYVGLDATAQRWVLRRPPLGAVLESAHDVLREQRIVSALAPSAIPVPRVVAACADPSVIGAPFYLMEFIDGPVCRTTDEGRGLTNEARAQAGFSLVDALARVHAVDVEAVGLRTLGKSDGFADRQIRRWRTQVERPGARDLPGLLAVADRLAARVPVQTETTLVHGDFRLDNCVLRSDGSVAAVLDWELATLGDPRSDVGLFLAYWGDPSEPFTVLPDSLTAASGFAGRAALLAAYETATGRDLITIDFWLALAYWKLACIVEGVYTRLRAGVMGEAAVDPEPFGARVPMLVEQADRSLDRLM